MKTLLNIQFNLDTYELVTTALDDSEIAKLSRAMIAHMRQDDASQFLTSSGLKLAFTLLLQDLEEAARRVAINRANGSKGGRPRKNKARTAPAQAVDNQGAKKVAKGGEKKGAVATVRSIFPAQLVDIKNPTKPTKKRKKEDLPPTPPIEEKTKKNYIITLSRHACAREEKPLVTVPDWDQLQEQLLHEQPWLEQLCMSRRISRQDMTQYVMDFVKYLRDQDLRETLSHAKAHFVNQLPYIIKIFKTNHNNEKHSSTHQEFIANPVARREFERGARLQEVSCAITQLAAQSGHFAPVPF